MSLPPLAPDDGPIDADHLQCMTLGDTNLEREVLAMFSAQAFTLISALDGLASDTAALVHTLKGSARAIGAFEVADAADNLEASIRNDGDPVRALNGLREAISRTRTAIDAILRRS